MQMELAGNLSSTQHNENRSKARNWKLQRLRQQPVTPPSPAGTPEAPDDLRLLPNYPETLAAFNEPRNAEPAKEPQRKGARSSRKLDRFFSRHQASHSSTTVSLFRLQIPMKSHSLAVVKQASTLNVSVLRKILMHGEYCRA